MLRVLVVESGFSLQRELRSKIERILGPGSVQVADTYQDAIVMLNGYSAYIIDGLLPRAQGKAREPLGIDLAKEIFKKEKSYDKIAMVSGSSSILRQAQQLGIENLYKKDVPDERAGERSIDDLVYDLRNFLRRST